MSNNPQTRYRHRTAEIEAVQWTGDNEPELSTFCSPFDFQTIDPEDRVEDPDQTAAVRESVHGTWQGLAPGDWVVKRGKDFYALSAADFAERYEPAVPVPPTTHATDALRDHIAEARVRALHRQYRFAGDDSTDYCAHCNQISGGWIPWPCPTMQALGETADASVLPPPADRAGLAAGLRAAADEIAGIDFHPNARARSLDIAAGLARRLRRMADEAQQQPDTETPVKPTSHAWTFEVCYDAEADKWHGCGPTYDSSVFDNAHEVAKDDFRHRAEQDRKRRKFRMVRATTTYTVEAEHQPAAGAGQDGAQQ